MFRKKMLVVDDNHLVRWALEKGLTANDLLVTVAETGRAALLEIEKTDYHLILLGLRLPDVNGLDLLGEITRRSPRSRVILTGADVSESDKEKAFSGGACQVLEKPFGIPDLQGLLRSAFGDYSRKRRHDRYICNLPFHVEFPVASREDGSNGSAHHRGSILDVGKEGIRLAIDRPLAVGQKLRLAHALEKSAFTRFIPPGARAEVVWVAPNADGCTAGMQFAV